jgi:ABC-type branched-subunit amino acid transport system permease subunit
VRRSALIGGVWAVALIAGFAVDNQYLLTVATAAAFLGLFSQSWNLQSGFTGNLSVGHSVFVAVPVYVTLILFQQAGVPPLLGGRAGVACAVAVAARPLFRAGVVIGERRGAGAHPAFFGSYQRP